MEEINRSDLLEKVEKGVTFVFFYTQMCGTCQLGEKMLSVLEDALEKKIYKSNINFLGESADKWQIESVPCLCVWENGEIVEKIYAFQSVGFLYEKAKKYC